MTTATIMATWFAAETILVTADEVRRVGVNIIVFEPIGIGLCIVLMGLFFARRLWEMKLMTLADLFRLKFGPATEKIQVFVAVSFVGWVAVQVLGLAGVFNVFFDLPIVWGVIAVTAVLTAYTLVGGMWSVALTDIVQLGLLLIGVVLLAIKVLATLGGGVLAGIGALIDRLDARMLDLVPNESFESLTYWVGLIFAGLFANIATQDLVQRVFSARSANTAARSCIAAGLLYAFFGMFPVLLGLAGAVLLDDSVETGVIAALAEQTLTPTMAVIFVLTLTAAVTSSVDSGLLAPASVMARNLICPIIGQRMSLIAVTRICVVVIGVGSAAMALSGTRAFDLIQGTYAVSIPPLVLLTAALYQKDVRKLPGLVTLGSGFALWLGEIVRNIVSGDMDDGVIVPGFPVYLLLGSTLIYVVTDRLVKWRVSAPAGGKAAA
jgi:Na+/proline symporter